MRRRAAGLAAATILAAGCASGDGGDDRLSREDYMRQADALCAEYDERLEPLRRAESVRALAPLAERALPVAREGVARLRALRPPQEIEARVREWLALNDANVERIAELRDAARAGDVTAVREIASAVIENERRADALARRLGLRACAEEEPG